MRCLLQQKVREPIGQPDVCPFCFATGADAGYLNRSPLVRSCSLSNESVVSNII